MLLYRLYEIPKGTWFPRDSNLLAQNFNMLSQDKIFGQNPVSFSIKITFLPQDNTFLPDLFKTE